MSRSSCASVGSAQPCVPREYDGAEGSQARSAWREPHIAALWNRSNFMVRTEGDYPQAVKFWRKMDKLAEYQVHGENFGLDARRRRGPYADSDIKWSSPQLGISQKPFISWLGPLIRKCCRDLFRTSDEELSGAPRWDSR